MRKFNRQPTVIEDFYTERDFRKFLRGGMDSGSLIEDINPLEDIRRTLGTGDSARLVRDIMEGRHSD